MTANSRAELVSVGPFFQSKRGKQKKGFRGYLDVRKTVSRKMSNSYTPEWA